MTDLATETAGPLAVEAILRAAKALTLSHHLCAEIGQPINEVQSIQIAAAFMQSFDGIERAMADMLSVDALIKTGRLRELLDPDHRGGAA